MSVCGEENRLNSKAAVNKRKKKFGMCNLNCKRDKIRQSIKEKNYQERNSKMRDVKKCISNNIIDNSTNVSVHMYYGSQRGDTSPEIEKEEVSIKQLVKGKAIENIVGFALMGIGGITKKFKLIEKLQLIDDRVDMIIENVVLFLCIVAGVVIIVTSIFDLLKIYI